MTVTAPPAPITKTIKRKGYRNRNKAPRFEVTIANEPIPIKANISKNQTANLRRAFHKPTTASNSIT